jgi:Protein of unknown function (DUF732)
VKAKVAAGSFAALAASVVLAAPANADKQGFLDFIHSQGVPAGYFGTAGADYSNVKAAEMICDVFHNGGTAADILFLGFQQNAYRDVLIDGARRFMCPDTQH